MVTCQACGTENPDSAAYCSQCARKLDVVTQRTIVEQRAAHSATGMNMSAVFAAIIVIIVVAVVLVLVFTHVL